MPLVLEKKQVSTILNFEFNILVFFFILDNTGDFQYVDCQLVSTSYFNIQVSSQVMMVSINSGYSSNFSRKFEYIVDERAFDQ